MLTKEDWIIFKKALKKSAEAILIPEEKQEPVLFNIWLEGVHEILIKKGCPCQSDKPGKCFLKLKKEEQLELMHENELLSFENFLDVTKKAKIMFFEHVKMFKA